MTDTPAVEDMQNKEAQEAEEARARQIIEDSLEPALRRFYDKVKADELIGPVFERAVHDWDAHIRIMVDFWSGALLGTGRYRGQPFAPHVPLRIGQAHFDRWLVLWKEAAEETMPPGLAAHVARMAGNMSHCWGRALESLLAQQQQQP
ncbi:MAG: group III truncated hemoglobin [Beijerinckiaceae bacterium]